MEEEKQIEIIEMGPSPVQGAVEFLIWYENILHELAEVFRIPKDLLGK